MIVRMQTEMQNFYKLVSEAGVGTVASGVATSTGYFVSG